MKFAPAKSVYFHKKTHNPVKAVTIGHWLKKVMKSAGIDTDIYKAHSPRGTFTSKAKAAGIPMAEILKAANWARPRLSAVSTIDQSM